MKKNKLTVLVLAAVAAVNVLSSDICTAKAFAVQRANQTAQQSGSRRPGSLSYSELRSIMDILDDCFSDYGICEAGLSSKNSAIDVTVTDHAKIPDIKKFLRKKGVSPRIISKNIKFTVVDTYITDDLVGYGDIIEDRPPVGMWTEDGKQYEYENGKYAVGATLIGGVMYDFDENCILRGLYTGWNEVTDYMGEVTKNYYIGGKRCAGWRTVDGEKYYFFYEGGTAVGDVQIEDKIYIFDDEGRFTGKTEKPVIYTKNIDDVSLKQLFADNEHPKAIAIPVWYKPADGFLFDFLDIDAQIEKYQNGRWVRLKRDKTGENGFEIGEALVGRGMIIVEDQEPDIPVCDSFAIHTHEYKEQLSVGKYRGAIKIRLYSPDDSSEYTDTYLYSYFILIPF